MGNYVELLDKATENVQKRIAELDAPKGKIKGTDFEKIVYDALLSVGIESDRIFHSIQKFPDFIIEDNKIQIGVEVKKTDADKWDVPGGSVYESMRNRIEETFVLMGKFGGTPEARIRRYEECISDLEVTHSPRFHLKIDLPSGEDYLTKNGASDLLTLPKGKELNRRIRELLRTNKSTWYSEETVESFSELSKEEKQNFFVDGVVLFPEVTGGDYSKFAPWMIYKCLVWCSNVRDVFSAGGTKELKEFRISAVMGRILERADLIVDRIAEMTPQEIKRHWGFVGDEFPLEDRCAKWIELIEKKISVSDSLIQINKDNHRDIFKWKRTTKYKYVIKTEFIRTLQEKINDELNKRKAGRENHDSVSKS